MTVNLLHDFAFIGFTKFTSSDAGHRNSAAGSFGITGENENCERGNVQGMEDQKN